jgi:hypothetical protein
VDSVGAGSACQRFRPASTVSSGGRPAQTIARGTACPASLLRRPARRPLYSRRAGGSRDWITGRRPAARSSSAFSVRR